MSNTLDISEYIIQFQKLAIDFQLDILNFHQNELHILWKFPIISTDINSNNKLELISVHYSGFLKVGVNIKGGKPKNTRERTATRDL